MKQKTEFYAQKTVFNQSIDIYMRIELEPGAYAIAQPIILERYPHDNEIPLSSPTMDTAWQRICKAMTEKDLVRFQFKDIRAKHASDLEDLGGDATANLLHSDRSVTKRHYLRKPKKVVSLR